MSDQQYHSPVHKWHHITIDLSGNQDVIGQNIPAEVNYDQVLRVVITDM